MNHASYPCIWICVIFAFLFMTYSIFGLCDKCLLEICILLVARVGLLH